MNCFNCVHLYYEFDTNYSECTNKDYDPDTWDALSQKGNCPGFYHHCDAADDAKLLGAEKGEA